MNSKKDSENRIHYLPVFTSIGIAIGLAIGAATNNIPIGMCIGLGVGMCIGSAIDIRNRKESDYDSQSDGKEMN